MKVLGLVKRNKVIKTAFQLSCVWRIPHMVGNKIRHYPYVSCVTSLHQRNKVLFGPKMWVDFEYVLGPVTVVTFVGVLHYWGNPNSVGSQTSDVVEVLLDTFECSSAIVLEIGTRLGWCLPRWSKAICKELTRKKVIRFSLFVITTKTRYQMSR